MLEREGHNNYHIRNVMSYVHSLRDMFQLWSLRLLPDFDLQLHQSLHIDLGDLSGHQLAAFSTFKNNAEERIADLFNNDAQWRKPTLITGHAGSGKTYVVHRCISFAIQQSYNILVTAPTGFLACKYKEIFGDQVTTNTIHGAFGIPISTDQPYEFKWDVSVYDLIVIDELSMVSTRNFRHIWRTINEAPVTPLLLMCGDAAQMKPIETHGNSIRQVESVLANAIVSTFNHFFLNQQHRCQDDFLNTFLNGIRTLPPSKRQLLLLNRYCLLTDDYDENVIYTYLTQNPRCVILTVTKKAANHLNMMILHRLFGNHRPLNTVQLDNDLDQIPIYSDLSVVVTQNQNKQIGVVNGQGGTVVRFENQTIFVRLTNGNIAPIYRVSDASGRTVYPLTLRYALTIAKVQGQTLPKALVYLDTPSLDRHTTYVALSRVRVLEDMKFITQIAMSHFN